MKVSFLSSLILTAAVLASLSASASSSARFVVKNDSLNSAATNVVMKISARSSGTLYKEPNNTYTGTFTSVSTGSVAMMGQSQSVPASSQELSASIQIVGSNQIQYKLGNAAPMRFRAHISYTRGGEIQRLIVKAADQVKALRQNIHQNHQAQFRDLLANPVLTRASVVVTDIICVRGNGASLDCRHSTTLEAGGAI